MDILNEVAKALKTLSDNGITCVCGWYDKHIHKTHITFYEMQESVNEYSEDVEEELLHSIQVDIWSARDDIELKKEVKKLMKAAGFAFIDSNDLYETDTKIYHKAMRFNFIEESEE